MAIMQKPDEQQPAGAGMNQATDEEEQAYVQAVENGRRVLLDPKSHDQSMQAMKSGKSPAEGIANLVTTVVMELDGRMDLPDTVIVPAANELIDHAAEIAEAAGIPVDEKTVMQANQIATMKLLQAYGADENDIRSVMGQFSDSDINEMVSQQRDLAKPWAEKTPMPTQQTGQAAPPAPGNEQGV